MTQRWFWFLRIVLFAIGLALVISPPAAVWSGISSGFRPNHMALVLAGLGVLVESLVLLLKNPVVKYLSSLLLSIILLLIWNVQLYPASGYDLNLFYPAALMQRILIACQLLLLFLAALFVAVAVQAVWTVLHRPKLKKPFIFGHILVIPVVVSLGIGLEAISAVVVPSWPARELRPIEVSKDWAGEAFGEYNAWGLRDRERTVQKPPGTKRVIFLGDSFLEGGFLPNTLSGYSRDKLVQSGYNPNIELVNLGVSATGTRHYLYRMRNIGMKLSPDAVLLFFYTGNDFVSQPYEQQFLTVIDELPLPSILGKLMPRFAWLLVNRLRLSEFERYIKPIPNEFEKLQTLAAMPYDKGVVALAEHMNQYYFPDLSPKRLEEILRLGGPAFWEELAPRETDRQYLQGWRVRDMITLTPFLRQSRETTYKLDYRMINVTAEYIERISRELQEHNIPLVVFLVPLALNMDPEYQRFWRSWYDSEELDKVRGWSQKSEAIFKVLQERGITVINLAEVLNGVPGTYRKFDGHWNERGHEVVAARVAEAIVALGLK